MIDKKVVLNDQSALTNIQFAILCCIENLKPRQLRTDI